MKEKMSKQVRWIKEGFLVIGDVEASGCTTYTHADRKEWKEGEVGKAEWETKKTVADVEEAARLEETCHKLRRAITSLGTHIGKFSLIPSDNAQALEGALRVVEEGCKTYNDNATCTSLYSSFLIYAVGGADARIAKTLYDRIVDVLDNVGEQIKLGDAAGIRKWLGELQRLGGTVPDGVGSQMGEIVEASRKRIKEALKSAKDAASDEKATAELVRKACNAKMVNSVRAQLVETRTEIETSMAAGPVLPTIDARQIE